MAGRSLVITANYWTLMKTVPTINFSHVGVDSKPPSARKIPAVEAMWSRTHSNLPTEKYRMCAAKWYFDVNERWHLATPLGWHPTQNSDTGAVPTSLVASKERTCSRQQEIY